MLTVKINKANFNRGLKTVKGWGFTFNSNTQTWSGKTPVCLQSATVDVAGYLRNVSLQLVQTAVDPATTWMGAASMDAADSIF